MCHFRLISFVEIGTVIFMVHGLVSYHTRQQPLLSLEIIQITGQFICIVGHLGGLDLFYRWNYMKHVFAVCFFVIHHCHCHLTYFLRPSSVTFYIIVTNANTNTYIGLLSTHTHNPPRFALNNNNNTQCHSKESIKVSQIKSTLNECQVIRSVDKSM